MIRINLLPYREEARKAKRQQFFSLAVLISLLAALVVFGGYSILGQFLSQQEGRNQFLKKQIVTLDEDLEEIKDIRSKIEAVANRKATIEALQKNRGEAVHLLSELAVQTPPGIYLKSLKQTGALVSVSGYAQSNSKISSFMRNIEASDWMEAPRLIEVKAAVVDKRRQNEFSLEFRMKRESPESSSNDTPKAKKGKK